VKFFDDRWSGFAVVIHPIHFRRAYQRLELQTSKWLGDGSSPLLWAKSRVLLSSCVKDAGAFRASSCDLPNAASDSIGKIQDDVPDRLMILG